MNINAPNNGMSEGTSKGLSERISEGPSDGTVGKALQLLDDVAAMGRPVRFSEILEQSSHPKATLYRLLQTLTNQGMLSYNDVAQTYSLGLRLVRLAHSAWAQSSLSEIASPHLEELAKKVHETLHLAQMESGQVIFVDKRQRSQSYDTLAQTGLVAPAHSTGVGKAILAFLSPQRLERAMKQQNFYPFTKHTHISADSLKKELEQIKEAGIAFDRQEHEMGIISIAAPILRSNGQPLGAVSIASSSARHTHESLSEFKPLLLQAVGQIADSAEAWSFPQAG